MQFITVKSQTYANSFFILTKVGNNTKSKVITYDQLLEPMTAIAAQINLAASLGHITVGPIVDIDNLQAEDHYTHLGFVRLDDKDYIGM